MLAYVWLGEGAVLVNPSPKSQKYEATPSMVVMEATGLKVNGTQPPAGALLMASVGGIMRTKSDLLIVLRHPLLSVMVRVTVNCPVVLY